LTGSIFLEKLVWRAVAWIGGYACLRWIPKESSNGSLTGAIWGLSTEIRRRLKGTE